MDLIIKLLSQISWETILISTLRIILILVIGWFVLITIKITLRRLEKLLIQHTRSDGEIMGETVKRAETLANLLRQALIIMVWTMMILMILRQVGIEIGPILASIGIMGLAVGFGAQNLVRDVITGFFMILENQIRIGDVAVVNGTGGLVEQINLRTIVLRDESGVVHVFPNGSINTLANVTREWSAYVFSIGVAYKENTDRVVKIMRSVGEELKHDDRYGAFLIADIEIYGVDQLADTGVTIKGRLKTVPIKQWEIGREYLRRIKRAFDQEGIEFTNRSLYFREMTKLFSENAVKQRRTLS